VEVFFHIAAIPFWSKLANFHGLLAMLSLILFGSAIVLFFLSDKFVLVIKWLKISLTALFVNLALLDIAGLVIYTEYRAPGGPRSILKSLTETSWLHDIVFEHKEFLAFAPPVLIFCAAFIVLSLGNSFQDQVKFRWLRTTVITSIILSLIFVLVVAGEAVLVAKVAPL